MWIGVIISPLNAKRNTVIWVCTDEYSDPPSTGQFESQIHGRTPKFTSGKLLLELKAWQRPQAVERNDTEFGVAENQTRLSHSDTHTLVAW
jgi:hypothetical protein